ncbi:hypothetical protein WMF31_07645 [Sorangium sp. So ce1036]|uniref:hypothetical protein n=1 Tax=Sorangium sp. So ce1036 TaxID=3133328 RepID=UPI003F06B52C
MTGWIGRSRRAAPVPNLTRVVVEGETVSEWLRLTVDPGAPVPFTWERVAVGG